jgi:CheY-like chemotaxis protein
MIQKILFFDDESFISQYLVNNLVENYGWNGEKEIVFAHSVVELLEHINEVNESYALFVLDVMAPIPPNPLDFFTKKELKQLDMRGGINTGIVIANKIRSIDRYRRVPILYLSARTIPQIPESEAGYTSYLGKPVSARVLSDRMEELLIQK